MKSLQVNTLGYPLHLFRGITVH